MKQGKVISFINMKGGVGKTTLCLELADQISRKQKDDDSDYKILLIDIDPQSNLTQAAFEHFFPNEDDLPSTKSIEMLFNKRPQGLSPQDIIVDLPETNIDLIPGELETIFLERASGNYTNQKLMDFIIDNNINQEYDFIFIDCPPTYSIYTEMAFFASDYYFVPVIPDKYSTLVVDLLERVVADIINHNKNSIFKDKTPKNIGLIFTRVDREKPKQNSYINAMKGSDIVQNSDIYIFEEYFKESNKLSTFELGKFVSDTDDSRLKEKIEKISDEFLSRIAMIEKGEEDR